jgi:uncharacterized protein YdhG (YjbR/CyaY superfamily)
MSMKAKATKPETIADYIACFPREVQTFLRKVRATVRKAAPGAIEAISYRIPVFRLKGDLVYFAAFKKHIGLYPRVSGLRKFKKELSGYKSAKGSVQFPLKGPIPYGLIGRIVKFRVKENLERAKAKRKA